MDIVQVLQSILIVWLILREMGDRRAIERIYRALPEYRSAIKSLQKGGRS